MCTGLHKYEQAHKSTEPWASSPDTCVMEAKYFCAYWRENTQLLPARVTETDYAVLTQAQLGTKKLFVCKKKPRGHGS